MSNSMTRRGILTLGAAGAALPLAYTQPASADPVPAPTDPGQLDDIFDVRNFGAKGDGVTIDTDAINQAIDAAAGTRPGPHGGTGGTVYFPAGTYASYSIHLKSNVALYLAQGATILAATPTNTQGYNEAEAGAGNPY